MTGQASDDTARIHEIFQRIQAAASNWYPTALSYFKDQPFKALIAGMLSARTREEDTLAACENLFQLAANPDDMLELTAEQIRGAIARVTYHETKAERIPKICQRLVENDGQVPRTVDELIEFEGVGWKVATLTLLIAYGIDEDIPVDVHVARIGKRMGLVNPETKQPQKVNAELKQKLPRAYWAAWNPLMVQFGREVCKPTYPQCRRCLVREFCPRIGV